MQPSAPFRDREFNGTTLLEEWAELRAAREAPAAVAVAALAVRPLSRARPEEAKRQLVLWATAARTETPVLSGLVLRWASRVRSELDVQLLAAHLERLAWVGEALAAEAGRP